MTDREKQIKALLESYCEWCKGQGGHCQAKLDGCSIADIKALLAEPESKEPDHIPEAEKKVGTGEFVKKVKRAIVDLVTVAPDDEEAAREAIVVLYNACDRLEALQAKLEAAKKRENYVECLEAGLRDRDTKLKVAFEVISMLKEKGIG